MSRFTRVESIVEHAIAHGVAPCAVAEVGDVAGPAWRVAAGRLTYDRGSAGATEATAFDLASLTKVLATTAIALRLHEAGRLALEAPVARAVRLWRGEDRQSARLTDLLSHASGLPAHRPYFETLRGRPAFEAAICAEPLEYVPGTASVYSDLGFILLGFLLEDLAGEPLHHLFDAVARDVGAGDEVTFRPARTWRTSVAPTRADPGRVGAVDDDNAAALGGTAGHAGLFGTVAGVGAFARAWLAGRLGHATALGEAGSVRLFTARAGTPGSSRALGWDTMLPTSSCGTRLSADAFGHTGFTGTSLWIDPRAGLYAVLLTNRVYPTPGPVDGITALRRSFHDAVLESWG